MRPFILFALALFAAILFGGDAQASVAARFPIAQPASQLVKIGHCGCRHCDECRSARYTAYRACGDCGCGNCPSPYRWGYGYAGYGCGCSTGRCTCGYCSHGCGKEGVYGFPGGVPGCGPCGCRGCGYYYSYTTTRCGGCATYGGYGYYPSGYYNGGWSVFGWLF